MNDTNNTNGATKTTYKANDIKIIVHLTAVIAWLSELHTSGSGVTYLKLLLKSNPQGSKDQKGITIDAIAFGSTAEYIAKRMQREGINNTLKGEKVLIIGTLSSNEKPNPDADGKPVYGPYSVKIDSLMFLDSPAKLLNSAAKDLKRELILAKLDTVTVSKVVDRVVEDIKGRRYGSQKGDNQANNPK